MSTDWNDFWSKKAEADANGVAAGAPQFDKDFQNDDWRSREDWKPSAGSAAGTSFGARGVESCWIIPKAAATGDESHTIEVFQESFTLRPADIIFLGCLFCLCAAITFKNYWFRYRPAPKKTKTIQLVNQAAAATSHRRSSSGMQLVINLEDSQKISFYHADHCGIKR